MRAGGEGAERRNGDRRRLLGALAERLNKGKDARRRKRAAAGNARRHDGLRWSGAGEAAVAVVLESERAECG